MARSLDIGGCSSVGRSLYSALLILTLTSTLLLLLSTQAPPSPAEAASYVELRPGTVIYVITPTSKSRRAHKADLTRLSQTLRLVPDLHWILVEDSNTTDVVIDALLTRSGLRFTHLATSEDPTKKKGRGMGQRNLGMAWLRQHFAGVPPASADGVVYFADDDNSYDLRLFNDYIRRVTGVGCWPVGFPSNQWVESAKVENGTVVGWDTTWNAKREFALDMAAFAINLSLILQHPEAKFGGKCGAGNYEPCFLKQLGGLKKENLTVFGMGDTREVFVWHTKTKQNEIALKGGKKGFIV